MPIAIDNVTIDGAIINYNVQPSGDANIYFTIDATSANANVVIQCQNLDATILWGDSTSNSYNSLNINPSHIYANSGTYSVTILGNNVGQITWGNLGSNATVNTISSFGNLGTTRLAVQNQNNMSGLPAELPSTVTNLTAVFFGSNSANAAFNNIVNWDTSKVTDMTNAFLGAARFNQPIGNWNVSNVANMLGTFYQANNFNQPIGNWNVSNVTNMETMFFRSAAFNQPIGNWNVSKVTRMPGMFDQATAFNQPIGNWNVSNVTSMGQMFSSASAFNQPIGSWNTGNVTNMDQMFFLASAFNQNLTGWCVTNITSEPPNFAVLSALTANNKPVWGTCP